MKKVKLALIATAAIFCFACGGKTEADFSIVPVEGANGEYQYIDISQKGKIVINPQFERARLFRDGLALVKTSGKEGKWGYIDKKGKYIIAPIYDYAQDFNDGVAWVQMENQPPMLIDKNGKMVLQMDSIISAQPFNNGIAGIKVYSRGQELTMFIDKKGKPVATTIPGEEVIPVISDGLYSFKDKSSEKWGYKNKNGEIVINAQYDDVDFFFDGMAATLGGKKWVAIDKKGNIIINPQYDHLKYDSDGLFLAKVGNKWGWVNKKNEIIINPQFDESMGFNRNKLAPVQMGSKWGYINKEGQIIINPQFGIALPFTGDYAMVVNTETEKKGYGWSSMNITKYKAGFIDKTGSFVVSPLYYTSEDYIYEYVKAIYQNPFGLALASGNFGPYDRLKEKQEEERERAIASEIAAVKASDEAKQPADNASGESFTDSRDGIVYKTVTIGNQTWIAQNLNYDVQGSKCYGNDESNCQIYGRLYNWSAATKACPTGWHLPSNEEWDILYRSVDGTSGTESPYKSETAGKYLKAKSGWNEGGNGTDNYGFAALPGGLGNSSGGFSSIGNYGNWWSSTEYDGSKSYNHFKSYKHNNAGWESEAKNKLFSVRCVMD